MNTATLSTSSWLTRLAAPFIFTGLQACSSGDAAPALTQDHSLSACNPAQALSGRVALNGNMLEARDLFQGQDDLNPPIDQYRHLQEAYGDRFGLCTRPSTRPQAPAVFWYDRSVTARNSNQAEITPSPPLTFDERVELSTLRREHEDHTNHPSEPHNNTNYSGYFLSALASLFAYTRVREARIHNMHNSANDLTHRYDTDTWNDWLSRFLLLPKGLNERLATNHSLLREAADADDHHS